jgi:hypothetical protein
MQEVIQNVTSRQTLLIVLAQFPLLVFGWGLVLMVINLYSELRYVFFEPGNLEYNSISSRVFLMAMLAMTLFFIIGLKGLGYITLGVITFALVAEKSLSMLRVRWRRYKGL